MMWGFFFFFFFFWGGRGLGFVNDFDEKHSKVTEIIITSIIYLEAYQGPCEREILPISVGIGR